MTRKTTESVWDYPRPPRLERSERHLTVVLGGVTIAESTRALRVLETSHPPCYYIPPEEVLLEHLRPRSHRSICEWKGQARYFDVVVGEEVASRAAWAYGSPWPGFEALADHLSFYAEPMDRCTVDGEVVQPQPGSFYGGWITSDLVGPFKGARGTLGW